MPTASRIAVPFSHLSFSESAVGSHRFHNTLASVAAKSGGRIRVELNLYDYRVSVLGYSGKSSSIVQIVTALLR